MRSALRLVHLALPAATYALVRPGCGNGQLQWGDVRPEIVDILDDRFTVVEANL